MSLRGTLPDPYCGAMGVVVLVIVVVAWIAIAVAATVWALRSRRHHRADATAASLAAAEAAVAQAEAAVAQADAAEGTDTADVDLTDAVDVSDSRQELPVQREI